jgi:hypothetical protein
MGRFSHLRDPHRVVGLVRRVSLVVLGLGVIAAGYGSGPARAADTYKASGTSWYWADQVQSIGVICPPDPVPQQCVPAVGQAGQLPSPDVPSGDMTVSVRNSSTNKLSALTIDLSSVPSGSSVTGATLKLVEDPAGGNSGQTGGATVVATGADYYAQNADARPINEAPNAVGTGAEGKREMSGTDGVWTFDVTAVLNKCLADFTANCAVRLAPPAQPSGTYEVVWYGDRSTSPTASAANKPAVTATVVQGEPTTTTPTFDTTSDTTLPSVTTTPATTSTSTSSFLSAGPPVPAPAVTTTTTTRPRTPTLRRVAKVDRVPPLGFYLAALGLAGLIGSSMYALGDDGEPVPPRRGSVVRTLERRMADPNPTDKE